MCPVALVTGANRGIGRESTRQLARLGYTVLLGSRDIDRGRAVALELASDGHVDAVRIDVTDRESVAHAASAVGQRFARLDALINNAGVYVPATALETNASVMLETFSVNVFGVVTAIHEFLPLLRQAQSPRIVNVSSTTGSLAITASGERIPGDAERRFAYASSKSALNMLTVQYARAFEGNPRLRHIKINSATPPYTATAMNRFHGTHSVEDGARIVVQLATLLDDGPSGGFFDVSGRVAW